MAYAPPSGPPPPPMQQQQRGVYPTQFPQSGPPRQLYSGPAPPSQIWNAPPGPPPHPHPQVQQYRPQHQPAWGPGSPPPPPPPKNQPWNPPQPTWAPPPVTQSPPTYGRWQRGSRPPFSSMAARPMAMGQQMHMQQGQDLRAQRHVGPSGPDGTWTTNDVVAEPEVMLNEEQLKVWKSFDNKELDRDYCKLSFLRRVKAGLDWNKWFRDQLKWKNFQQWIIGAITLAIVLLVVFEQHRIVDAIKPTGEKIQKIHLGWLIPAAALFVLSFPPLFGAEIIVLIVAIVWNVWAAWGITTLGTFAGEVANFWLWKWLMSSRQQKVENKSLYWAKLSKVSRKGGFLICLVIRYSLVPTHLSTTLFAACGIPWWTYFASTLLSQPRWLFHVFVGHAYSNAESNSQKVLFTLISILMAAVTQVAMMWVEKKMNECDMDVKQIIRQRRADALNAVRTPLSEKVPVPTHKRAASSVSTLAGDVPPPPSKGVYRVEALRQYDHRLNESTSSLGSSTETAVGSTVNLGQYKDVKQ